MKEVTKEELFTAKLRNETVIAISSLDLSYDRFNRQDVIDVLRQNGWMSSHSSKNHSGHLLYIDNEYCVLELVVFSHRNEIKFYIDAKGKYFQCSGDAFFLVVFKNQKIISIEEFPRVSNANLVVACRNHLGGFPELQQRYNEFSNHHTKVRIIQK